MKKAATDPDRAVRKRAFVEYFEEFHEFPSYLFDNEQAIDSHLFDTMQDILKDPETTKTVQVGVDVLLRRLPPRHS